MEFHVGKSASSVTWPSQSEATAESDDDGELMYDDESEEEEGEPEPVTKRLERRIVLFLGPRSAFWRFEIHPEHSITFMRSSKVNNLRLERLEALGC